MQQQTRSSHALAVAITKSASKQTYATIRLFADRDRASDAFRAYAYFRWVDDVLDAEGRRCWRPATRGEPGAVYTRKNRCSPILSITTAIQPAACIFIYEK